MWHQFLCKIVNRIDPKLAKYRQANLVKSEPKSYTPTSIEDFIALLRRTPKNILSSKDRKRISAIMSFNERKVQDLMISKQKMVFVQHKEFLGPLILDKLYQSGFTNFPVVNRRDEVIGVIHTEALNALEIKKTDRAEKYITKDIYYLHTDNSLEFMVQEFKRTNSCYFLVKDRQDHLVGFITVQMLLDYLLN